MGQVKFQTKHTNQFYMHFQRLKCRTAFSNALWMQWNNGMSVLLSSCCSCYSSEYCCFSYYGCWYCWWCFEFGFVTGWLLLWLLSQLLLLLCADNGIAIKVERDGAEKITKQSSENLSCTHSFPSSPLPFPHTFSSAFLAPPGEQWV